MSYLKLPKRAFNSPLIEYVNFKDGSVINLIRLNKPYKNGISYAVYETTKSPFCSNGLFKTIDKAKEKFNLMVKNNSFYTEVTGKGIINNIKFMED